MYIRAMTHLGTEHYHYNPCEILEYAFAFIWLFQVFHITLGEALQYYRLFDYEEANALKEMWMICLMSLSQSHDRARTLTNFLAKCPFN